MNFNSCIQTTGVDKELMQYQEEKPPIDKDALMKNKMDYEFVESVVSRINYADGDKSCVEI